MWGFWGYLSISSPRFLYTPHRKLLSNKDERAQIFGCKETTSFVQFNYQCTVRLEFEYISTVGSCLNLTGRASMDETEMVWRARGQEGIIVPMEPSRFLVVIWLYAWLLPCCSVAGLLEWVLWRCKLVCQFYDTWMRYLSTATAVLQNFPISQNSSDLPSSSWISKEHPNSDCLSSPRTLEYTRYCRD